MIFTANKRVVAEFVKDLLLDSRFDSASITITTQGTSEDCSAHIAIDTLLEGIALEKAKTSYSPLTIISQENTQDGSSQQK